MATQTLTTPRFHNHSAEMLADLLGDLDARAKALVAEIDAVKAELKRRGLTEAAGDSFTVTITEQIQGRLDSKAIREYLGEQYARFEKAIVSNVVRIKAVSHVALPLAA